MKYFSCNFYNNSGHQRMVQLYDPKITDFYGLKFINPIFLYLLLNAQKKVRITTIGVLRLNCDILLATLNKHRSWILIAAAQEWALVLKVYHNHRIP